MKSGLPFKAIAKVFLAAALSYLVAFYLIEYWRGRNGPWQVGFASEGGHPVLTINQPRLNITGVKISFPNRATAATNTVMVFNRPREWPFDVPFGQCVFQDLITQPGTVTFKIFDHEIQLLPSMLT